MSLRSPESLHTQVRKLSKRDGISINQFIATALAEKMSAMVTREYLEVRAGRGSREKFKRAMTKVADVEPEERDRM